MYIFDFNIHLPFITHEDVNVVINQDMSLDLNGIAKGFETHKTDIAKCDGANFMLFNTTLFQADVSSFFKTVETAIKQVKYTALLDFRDKKVYEYIDNLKASGVHAIMFNSYLQQISESDFNELVKICLYAEKKGLIICIDGSYGTSKMYSYDNIKLACTVADFVTQTPIVIVHSGGYRLIEAMLLAADKKNVWLDTSFSLPYYFESSIEIDFAYVMKQLKMERVIFGSDHPYITHDEAIEKHHLFFKKYKFNDTDIEKVMGLNAQKLFNEQ